MTKGEKAVAMRDAGLSNTEIALALGMPKASARRLISETREAKAHPDAWRLKALCHCTEASWRNCPRHQNAQECRHQFIYEPHWPYGRCVFCDAVDWESPQWGHLAQAGGVSSEEEHRLKSEATGSSPVPHPPMKDLVESFLKDRGVSFGKPTTLTSHIVIPDTQCKPGVPLDHLRWAGAYIAERKPDVVVHLGDHWDMPSLSSYEKRGSRYFEGRRYRDDIDAGNEGMRLLLEGMGDWRPSRMVLLRGNHEDRVTRAVNEDPRLEGVIGMQDFEDAEWEVHDFLEPVEIDGVTYAHYFANPGTGRSYSGNVDTMLRNIGFTFTMGHQQGLRFGRRELTNGVVQLGLVAGSFYQHNEDYRGPQARSEWRGLIVKHEVGSGYDPMFVSMDYLKRQFG